MSEVLDKWKNQLSNPNPDKFDFEFEGLAEVEGGKVAIWRDKESGKRIYYPSSAK